MQWLHLWTPQGPSFQIDSSANVSKYSGCTFTVAFSRFQSVVVLPAFMWGIEVCLAHTLAVTGLPPCQSKLADSFPPFLPPLFTNPWSCSGPGSPLSLRGPGKETEWRQMPPVSLLRDNSVSRGDNTHTNADTFLYLWWRIFFFSPLRLNLTAELKRTLIYFA